MIFSWPFWFSYKNGLQNVIVFVVYFIFVSWETSKSLVPATFFDLQHFIKKFVHFFTRDRFFFTSKLIFWKAAFLLPARLLWGNLHTYMPLHKTTSTRLWEVGISTLSWLTDSKVLWLNWNVWELPFLKTATTNATTYVVTLDYANSNRVNLDHNTCQLSP